MYFRLSCTKIKILYRHKFDNFWKKLLQIYSIMIPKNQVFCTYGYQNQTRISNYFPQRFFFFFTKTKKNRSIPPPSLFCGSMFLSSMLFQKKIKTIALWYIPYLYTHKVWRTMKDTFDTHPIHPIHPSIPSLNSRFTLVV